jgi:hypothetical protein
MLELGSSGSVRGVSSNGHPYRDRSSDDAALCRSISFRQSSQAVVDRPPATNRPRAACIRAQDLLEPWKVLNGGMRSRMADRNPGTAGD